MEITNTDNKWVNHIQVSHTLENQFFPRPINHSKNFCSVKDGGALFSTNCTDLAKQGEKNG